LRWRQTDTQTTLVVEYDSRSDDFGSYWRQYWFEHQNFRDERIEAFASLLWEDVYNYSSETRARTVRRAARESRSDVSSRNLRPNRHGCHERGVTISYAVKKTNVSGL
jgi:hypothetical protein